MPENQNEKPWKDFLEITKSGVEKGLYQFKEISATRDDGKGNEIFLFVNFDICNFTKYKREHSTWLELLRKFIHVCLSKDSYYPLEFWKFNGDSITYKLKIQSVHEICRYIKSTLYLLTKIQDEICIGEIKKVYVKAGIWICEFPQKYSMCMNNTRIETNMLGREFVGENVDEGFRLCACSKADILVVDPKIVYLINLYDEVLNNASSSPKFHIDSEMLKKAQEKIKNLEQTNQKKFGDFRNTIKEVNRNLYFAEFQKCKGVWDDRDYPIFWYIEKIENKNFVYDEIVGKKMLLEHDIYQESLSAEHDKEQREHRFKEKKDTLMRICSQNQSVETIRPMIDELKLVPDSSTSGKYIFDKANLYYMIACVLRQNNEDLGVLIFRRGDESKRKHLQKVWDLVPVKHARLQSPKEYLQQMLIQHLSLDDIEKPLPIDITIDCDNERDSIKPYALCNIYRNGEIHNGILCVAELNVNGTPVDSTLEIIKNAITNKGYYTDAKLISLNQINADYIIQIDGSKIRSLTPQEVETDSINAMEGDHKSSFESQDGEDQYGVSYLSYSIKQILEGRRR